MGKIDLNNGLCCAITVLVVLAAGVTGIAAKTLSADDAGLEPTADSEPVIMTGSQFPDLDGVDIARIGLFAWTEEEGFVAVPFQVDERLDYTFSPGGVFEFTQNIHDIFQVEDGTLDADDEIVYLFRFAEEERAPVEATWPPGSDNLRYEIEVEDPTGTESGSHWVYLFTGDGLPTYETSPLVNWEISRTSAVQTELYALDFVDRWLLLGYHVLAPCGDGSDLIDRVKGRAGLRPDQGETEELWNAAAFFMGGIVGPVRAIRYVRGAASGINSIHHDIFYPDVWERNISLRVHPLDNVWMYVDWLPGSVDTLFSPDEPGGVPIDGSPDKSVGDTPVPWELVRGPDGGIALVYDIPPNPLISERLRYYVDDDGYDDAPNYPPNYPDEDDVAIGNFGWHLSGLLGQETDEIRIGMRAYPLCGGVGDAAAGAGYYALATTPPITTATPQWGDISPVRDLRLRSDSIDVVLDWSAIPGATTFRVYVSDDVSLDPPVWTLLSEDPTNGFVDAGAVAGPNRFYTVVVVDPEGQEIP